MNTEGILGRRLNWWRCFPLELDGRMPCESCDCFDRSTLECVQPGGRVGHEVLNMVRDRYVKGPQCPEVPTSDERREVAARLRDEAGKFRRLEKEWGHEPTIDLGDVTAVFQDVAHFAGLDGTVRTCVLLDRLADLIDPEGDEDDTD